ncbi:MAG: rhodanese-like domain-containing protein [Planctomycetaceae bacterium]
MKYLLVLLAASAVAMVVMACTEQTPPDVGLQAADKSGQEIDNPAIDMPGFIKVAKAAAEHRKSRRLTEDEFIRMSREPGTIVLDARSEKMYNLLHVKGAINLSFPDIAIESLKETIPDKNTRILIYCNNNFKGALKPFPNKAITASLNLSTYASLYGYGYKNVYELGPLIDIKQSKLEFEPREEWVRIKSGS